MSTVHFCGLDLKHPVINGSGTFDLLAAERVFGEAILERFPFAAFVSKTITVEARAGNPPPRLYETPAGMVNSIGLPGPGIDRYIEKDLPLISRLPVPLITNVMGSTAAEVATMLERLSGQDTVRAIELNVSCPNVKTGLDIGSDALELSAFVQEVRPRTTKPLLVKLTPNVTNLPEIARAAEASGADALSLVNTLRAWAPHPERPGEPWLGASRGGLSGPAIRAVALSQVESVAEAVSIPVVGMGGIAGPAHARQFLDAGATLVAVGTESFREPLAAALVASGLAAAT